MKYKVSELDGALLDVAVAKATGFILLSGHAEDIKFCPSISEGEVIRRTCFTIGGNPFAPSYSWSDGGALIEHYRIGIGLETEDLWSACVQSLIDGQLATGPDQYGPTPLIAAMRAFVASKFGEEVELYDFTT